jgi:serine/threonine protein kinase
VVTDFGLARISQSEDADGAAFTGRYEFVGTPVYMSPEQVEGSDVTSGHLVCPDVVARALHHEKLK